MKLSDDEVIAKVEYEERIAYGINDAELSDQRAKAISYYLGEPFGNEVEGRSQVVSYDVQDTVESSLPQLIKIFTSGDQVVRFDPKGPEELIEKMTGRFREVYNDEFRARTREIGVRMDTWSPNRARSRRRVASDELRGTPG